jgi:hypothetical protein
MTTTLLLDQFSFRKRGLVKTIVVPKEERPPREGKGAAFVMDEILIVGRLFGEQFGRSHDGKG